MHLHTHPRLFALLHAGSIMVASTLLAANPAPEKLSDGIVFPCNGTFQKIEVRADGIIRIAVARDRVFFDRASLMLAGQRAPTPTWRLETSGDFATVRTDRLQVRVDLRSGDVTFLDDQGRQILGEQPGARVLEAAEVQGEKTWHVRQAWQSQPDEALYGLGSNQLGLLNLKGRDLDLWQHNGTVAVPFLVSSRGYGLLWDNNSYTRFGDLRQTEQIPAAQLFDRDGRPGGFTATYFAGADFAHQVDQRRETKIDIAIPDSVKQPNHDINPALPLEGTCSVRWEGYVEPKEGGLYTFETYSNSGIKLWIDDRLVMDHWRQGWLPWFEVAQVQLEQGRRTHLKLEWSRDDGMPTMRLRWKPPGTGMATSLWSEFGDGIDYYFVYGPKIDEVIAGYRQLTGAAPLMPIWAFGLWQSRERYETAQASLEVVKKYRELGIPFDNIVQDWRYWPEKTWGSHQFDPARFPDPDAWINAVHDEHAHLMLSVWGKFEPGTDNFAAMRSHGYLYERNLKEGTVDWLGDPYTFYDAFNPGARKMLWDQMAGQLFTRGIDAWWMDATEPDLRPTPTLDGQRDYANPTALGPGARVLNAYSLVNSAAVYDGQRAAAPGQRVFILTRSGFAGQQRYGAATWSGDISSTWTAMQKQIPLGLSFSISGLPYWTMDSGGFSVPARFSSEHAKPADVDEWRELNTRWFEFAAFVPLLRAHGQFPYREMWQFGGEKSPAFEAMLKFDRLRYRLLPYIYSVAGAVTHQNSTFMRALVMDFGGDQKTHDIGDQYMFGPAFLVNPVTTYQARTRPVYLPAGTDWYDFWTGAAVGGGQTIDAAAPYDRLPLYVRAGAIVPFGPEIQYVQEKPADPITLFVYAGAKGSFTLYEDDGLTYSYEKGAFSRIPLAWDEARRTLTIGARQGSFPGMLAERTFQVVLVTKDRPVDFSLAPKVDRIVPYHGDAVTVPLQ
jgi:alpha-D-xyloside xylohydrolase